MTQMEFLHKITIYNGDGNDTDKAFYKAYKIMRDKYIDASDEYFDDDNDSEVKYAYWMMRNACIEMLCYLVEDFYKELLDKNIVSQFLEELYDRIRVR